MRRRETTSPKDTGILPKAVDDFWVFSAKSLSFEQLDEQGSVARRAVLPAPSRLRRAPLLCAVYPDTSPHRPRGVCGVPRPSPAECVPPFVPRSSRARPARHCAGPLQLQENAAAPVFCAGRLEILPLDIMRARVCRVLCRIVQPHRMLRVASQGTRKAVSVQRSGKTRIQISRG